MVRTPLLTMLLLAAPVWADAGVSAEPDGADAGAEADLEDGGVLVAAEVLEVDEEADDELEEELVSALADAGILYTADLSDEELTRRWVEEPESLGSLSFGLTEAGRLVNAVPVPPGDAWQVVDPNNAWGTQETIDFLVTAATAVRDQYPDAPPLRINHIARRSGGYLRPHQSHQAGRDADLGFYYPRGEDPGRLSKRRDLAMELSYNWALLKSLVSSADVQFVLVDRRIQARLYAFALSQGEDKAWLDRLFHAGAASLIKHARRHRDHFHVRFFSPRSQELGRRIQPLLARQPEQNLVIHRVRRGDTLGALAMRFNSGVKLIQKANGLTSTALRVGRTLNIPLRGPCTNCPVPPPLVVPPRCLPPPPPPKS